MMWPGRDEPLYEQRLLGERVRFLWRQDGLQHTVRAEWIKGDQPWDIEAREASDSVRNLAIQKVTGEIEALIAKSKHKTN